MGLLLIKVWGSVAPRISSASALPFAWLGKPACKRLLAMKRNNKDQLVTGCKLSDANTICKQMSRRQRPVAILKKVCSIVDSMLARYAGEKCRCRLSYLSLKYEKKSIQKVPIKYSLSYFTG